MTHVADVVIQSSQVPSDLTDFPILIDLSDLPTTGFWDTVANGGGDIRCFKSDGTTELAREVVSCDTSTDTGELWVKFSGTLSSSSNTTIQIHADGTSSEPASDATYGSEAVWSDYIAVWHGEDANDSTGNSFNLSGSGTAAAVAAQVGDGQDLDSNENLYTTNSSSFAVTGAKTIQQWVKLDSVPTTVEYTMAVVQGIGSSTADNRFRISGGELDYQLFDGAGKTVVLDATPSTDTWMMLHGAHDGTTMRGYFNGSETGSTAAGTSFNAGASARVNFGRTTDSLSFTFDEARYRSSTLSADWIEAEYNNQNSPSTFYTASAVGGSTFSIALSIKVNTLL